MWGGLEVIATISCRSGARGGDWDVLCCDGRHKIVYINNRHNYQKRYFKMNFLDKKGKLNYI